MELENTVTGHPAVAEATEAGVPDPRWEERPPACVTLRGGAAVTPGGLREFLTGRIRRSYAYQEVAVTTPG